MFCSIGWKAEDKHGCCIVFHTYIVVIHSKGGKLALFFCSSYQKIHCFVCSFHRFSLLLCFIRFSSSLHISYYPLTKLMLVFFLLQLDFRVNKCTLSIVFFLCVSCSLNLDFFCFVVIFWLATTRKLP